MELGSIPLLCSKEFLSPRRQFSRPLPPPHDHPACTPEPEQSSPAAAAVAAVGGAPGRRDVSFRRFSLGCSPEECPYSVSQLSYRRQMHSALAQGLYDSYVPFNCSRKIRSNRIVISGFGCLTPLGNS